ncbi:MAG: helicase-exonuclease AddAB subunit AddA [Oscillospiraceae bacterium]
MVKLTPEQQAAVENRGGSLLVSAAAGSGKTKVLVERLFRYVEEDRCNIDDFLIITYTRAAAAELRGKIADELSRRLAETPEDGHLQRQLLRVYRADIKTVDAFCTGLLRESAHLLGEDNRRCLTPDFRVMDEDEAELLRRQVLHRVLDRFYETLTPGGTLLADTLGAGRDDGSLTELVLSLLGKLQSHAYPQLWLTAQQAFWAADSIDETPYTRELLTGIRRKADHLHRLFLATLEQMETVAAVQKGYGAPFAVMADSLSRLAEAQDWQTAAAIPLVFPRLGSVKDSDGGDVKAVAKQRWELAKKDCGKLSTLLAVSREDIRADLQAVQPAMLALISLTRDFSAAYQAEKLRKNCTDFSDQEHLALEILVREDGTSTEQGELIAARYREVLVDEYQDTNEVQNHIFRAVSHGGQNLFTVGDVKQSIYRFRLADPGIFLENYRAFAPAETAEDGESRKITLARNFRSRAEVLDAANFVFENIMSTDMGEMDYGAEERLYCGADYYLPRTDCETEYHLIDVPLQRGVEKPASRAEIEAQFVAERIAALLDEGYPVQDGEGFRPCRPEDIVILMRSPAARAAAVCAALANRGIPCRADTSGDFFATMEIAVVYNLLQIIDNPRQDVPLISVLRSPLFGFTPDRLAEIRAKTATGDFYHAVQENGGTDTETFLETLDELRRTATDVSVHRLLWHLYNTLHVLGIFGAMEGGEERKENLIALFEHARRFEASGYRGVFGFVTQLRRLLEAEREPATVRHTASGGVRLMSIHRSKGLEFPIVLLADLSKPFSKMDFQTPVLVHPTLGLGPMRVDLERHIQYPTLARQAIEQRLQRESKAEEMRILYVAMTRPKEKLILIDSRKGAAKQLQRLLATASCPALPESVDGGTCMGDWILLPLLCRPEAAPLRALAEMEAGALYTGDTASWQVICHDGSGAAEGSPSPKPVAAETADSPTETAFPLLDFVYPYAAEITLPAKLTATQLKGREIDSEIAERAALPPRIRPLSQPRFLQESLGLTGAERGTAVHLALQYLDFSNPDIAGQLDALRARQLLSDVQAAAIDPSELARLLASPLAERLRSAKTVLREYRFTLLVDAAQYEKTVTSHDRILLQGVVDCCFADEDGLHIVDFKTDHVFGAALTQRAESYRPQLTAYSQALERVLELPVKSRILYFLSAGVEIAL